MRDALTRVHGIDRFIAGDAVVPDTELEKKLGRAAYLTWTILCAHRDYQGETHITVRGMLRAKSKRFAGKLARTPLLKALARLADSKLVENLGYQLRVVKRRESLVNATVYVRRVRGARVLRTSAQAASACVVPAATRAWLTSAQAWGGARRGAGRKNSRRDLDHMPQKNSRRDHLEPQNRIQGGASIESISNTRENTGCGSPLPSVGETRGAASAPPHFEEFEGGLAGRALRPSPLLGFPFHGVPRYPGISIVAPATLPDAPLLDPASTDEVLAMAIMRAYRGAIETRYGGRCWLLAKGAITRSKHYKALVTFAGELISHEIAPAAWCIHRVDKWRASPGANRAGRPAQPTIGYVFAAKAIDDANRWQYRVEYGETRLGGRQIFSKAHLDLLARYKHMHGDIVRGVPKVAAVEKHFPEGLYNELVDQARMEAAETRYRLEDQIKRGVHVW